MENVYREPFCSADSRRSFRNVEKKLYKLSHLSSEQVCPFLFARRLFEEEEVKGEKKSSIIYNLAKAIRQLHDTDGTWYNFKYDTLVVMN